MHLQCIVELQDNLVISTNPDNTYSFSCFKKGSEHEYVLRSSVKNKNPDEAMYLGLSHYRLHIPDS